MGRGRAAALRGGRRADAATADALDQASLGSSVVALEDSPILLIKLDNSFVENFNIEEFVRGLPGDAQNRRIRLMAWNTVFGGDRTHLGGVTYDILDAEWAIFTSPLVSFDGACFDCEAEDDEGLLEQAVNLRDTTFTPSVRRVSFDDCIFTGDTRELTFEDAVFSGAHVSFARTDFGSTEPYCYQAVFGGGTAIEFIEARQEGARFSFLRTLELGGHGQAEGRLTFYRVNPLPQLDLSFRNADTVHLENSTLIAPLRVANIRPSRSGPPR